MDQAKFFEGVRKLTGPLALVQVQVIEEILWIGRALSAAHLAYILATGWGEAKLTPKRENMNYRAARIKQVWPGRPEAVQFAGKPRELANSVYGGRLGNRPGTDDGWIYRGGGVDQLTGRENYTKIGLEDNPEAIMQPDKAAWSIVHGMTTGRYRKFKLSDFGDGASFNAVKARAIVNDDVKLHGAKYEGYYRAFLVALANAGYKPSAAVPLAKPKPVIDAPKAVAGGLVAALVAVLAWGGDIVEKVTAWLL